MPRGNRIIFEEAFYHIYNRGVDKQPIVHDDIDRKVFMELLGQTVKKYSIRLFAYCLMNNHFHLFLQTPEPNIDEAMWHMFRQYSSYFNKRHERVGPLFQNRYQAKVVDSDAYAKTLIRYIHQNPVQAHIVDIMAEYNWSSYPCYLRKLGPWSWLETKWPLQVFNANKKLSLKPFLEFHQHETSKRDKALFESKLRILGSPNFIERIKKKAA